MYRYRFRAATSEDKKQLLMLLDRGGDVPVKWRNKYVIEQDLLGVHVIDMVGKIIGMVHMSVLPNGEAWLQSAYILPEYRGRGIGSNFARYQIRTLRKAGAHTARLATGYSNQRVQHMMKEKAGFTEMSTWQRMQLPHGCRLPIPKDYTIRPASAEDVEPIWQFITSSSVFKKSHGLVARIDDPYIWQSLSIDYLRSILEQGLSFRCFKGKKPMGVALAAAYNSLISPGKSYPLITQIYTGSSGAYQALLGNYLSSLTQKALLVSVSHVPDTVFNKLMQYAPANKRLIRKVWIVMGRRIVHPLSHP